MKKTQSNLQVGLSFTFSHLWPAALTSADLKWSTSFGVATKPPMVVTPFSHKVLFHYSLQHDHSDPGLDNTDVMEKNYFPKVIFLSSILFILFFDSSKTKNCRIPTRRDTTAFLSLDALKRVIGKLHLEVIVISRVLFKLGYSTFAIS